MSRRKTPLASAVFADMTGLPRLLIHVSGREVLYDSAISVYGNAKKAGVDAELLGKPEFFHVRHAFTPMLDAGREVVDRIDLYFAREDGVLVELI